MCTKGKDVLLIGGSRGIGAGLKDAFSESNLISVDRSVCDISNTLDIDELFSSISNIDILINNAAVCYAKPIEEIELSEWDEVLSINLTSYFYIIKKAIPLMRPGSKIVNVSSIAGRHRSLVSGVHYTSSKAGLIGLTRQLAQELGPKGININCVCPSQTMTPMLKQNMSDEDVVELSKRIPLGRIATVDEIVQPILFLCSDQASYIHGACIDINGGQL